MSPRCRYHTPAFYAMLRGPIYQRKVFFRMVFCRQRTHMGHKDGRRLPQITIGNSETALIPHSENMPDGLHWWAEQYFRLRGDHQPRVTESTAPRSGIVPALHADRRTDGSPGGVDATALPRFSAARAARDAQGRRVWSDKTLLRIMAHLKTFAKWVHKLRPFPLGNPMGKLKLPTIGMGLEVERALTPAERRKLLDAADIAPHYWRPLA